MFSYLKALKRLSVLTERVETIERENKAIRLEWEDTYDKLRAVMQRVAKRAQRVEQLAPEEPGMPVVEPENPDRFPGLTPRQAEVQQKIMARRARMGRPQ
jgi:hypothetical protein